MILRRLAFLSAGAVFALFAALVVPGSAPQRWLLRWISGEATAVEPLQPASAAHGRPGPALRVAVGAMISPERAYVHYGRFFTALAARRGERLELVQRTTYREVNDLLRGGDVDLAWICTGAWPELEASRGARLIAVPVMYGKSTYQSFLVAGPSTAATSWEELRGARFAFTDPLSLTGRLWPMRRVRELTGGDERHFGSTLFTHGHDLSIEAVRRGLVDAASVDSLVYLFLAERAPREVLGVRVLERSPELPIPPLVVTGKSSTARADALTRDLFELAAAPGGRAILGELAVDGFARPNPSAYRALP